MDPLDTVKVKTDAGTYSIEVHYDEEASYEEGDDRYGYSVLSPNGDIVGGLWAVDGDGDYLEELAREEIYYDARDRLDQANTVGAGFVGVI